MPGKKVEPVYYPLESSWGVFALAIAGQGKEVLELCLPGHTKTLAQVAEIPQSAQSLFKKVRQQLLAYLEGSRNSFTLPLNISHGTSFQRSVWQAIAEIPPALTATYGEIAVRIGKPRAVRAVGTACGANPLPIFIPCHRVVAAHSLGGFGSGLALKKKLLAHEKKYFS